MSAKRRNNNEKKSSLTPIVIGVIVTVTVLFFVAIFVMQPSTESNALGGSINVKGDKLPDLPSSFSRDCIFFENLNYCQQMEPAAKLDAPTITGTDLDGEAISTEISQPRIIIFLAHWCRHCQQEVPVIQQWIDENGDPEPIKIFSVLTSINSTQPNYPPDKWLKSENWTMPTFSDNDQDGVAKHFGVKGFPFWVLIDHHGKVITRLGGGFTAEEFEGILANTLNYDSVEHADHH